MTNSPSDPSIKARLRLIRSFSFSGPVLGLVAALAATSLWFVPEGVAQTDSQSNVGAPLQLVPLGNSNAESAPSGGASDGTQEKSGISVLSLDQVDMDGLGVLDPAASGLGPAPWEGTSRGTAIALLRQLSLAVASPVLLPLGERLLLANAPPPSGEESAGSSFLDLRLQQLFDWGLAGDVQSILARLPHSRQSETTFRLSVQALLTDGQDQAACDIVGREIVAYSSQEFWAKSLIYCQILEGQIEQAYLGLDLLRETGETEDPLFNVLAQRFAGADAALKGDMQASVLNFAMLRHLDAPIPQGFAAKAPRALWPALAASDKLDPLERASLSEAALSSGLITGETLGAAYRALPFTADELAGAVTSAKSLDGVLGRALLFQAAEAQTLVVARVEMLKSLLDLAQSERRMDVVLAVVAPLLQNLRPRTDMAWFAEAAARSFYILDDLERARAWVRLIERDAETSPEAQAALLRLWPLARLRGHKDLLPSYNLAAWAHQIQPDEAGETESHAATMRQIYLLFAAFRNLDQPDSTSITDLPGWTTTEESFVVRYPLLLALRDAGADHREGESILLALAALGMREWDQVAVVKAAEILDVLRGLGLQDEARQLATEIALANGL